MKSTLINPPKIQYIEQTSYIKKKSKSKQIKTILKKHLVTEHEQRTRSLMENGFLCEQIQQKEGYAESNLTSNAKFSTLNSKTCRA